jgi:periplasmic copper chaperone A
MRRRLVLSGLCCMPLVTWAHGFRAGDLRIDHPYATPSRPGVQTGAVYFRGIENRGRTADRLLSASTPVATSVEIHQMHMDGDIMRMKAVPDLELPARTVVRMRHSTPNGYHLMLLELKAPLKDGDRFPLTLTFENSGEVTVQVWVQTPRTAEHHHH